MELSTNMPIASANATQRHDVERDAREIHEKQRNEHGERNGERHDERRFPIAQEEREHHDSEQRAQEQRLQDRIDVERDVRALIAHDVE